MRRVLAAVLVSVGLTGCGILSSPIPLNTKDDAFGWRGGCILMHQVVDVVADPATGTPVDKASGEPFAWPTGMTARQAAFGSEVEVLDPQGSVVTTTGGRYWMCPSEYLDGWVIGDVKPCPDCTLGPGLD
jgi:hypothetical protein